MRPIRIGLFQRETSPVDGGADTLLRMVGARLASLPAGEAVELVPVPWAEWSYRRQPFRQVRVRLARWLGEEIPWADVRPVCDDRRLDAAYFEAPAFVEVTVPFIMAQWDVGHRTIPDFPEVRSGRDSWAQREAIARRMLPQASAVIVGNRTGADEVVELCGVRRDRVAVLPFPNPDFPAATVPDWLPAGPFFLYPAQAWPHKNHVTLLHALLVLKQGSVAANLVLVGSDKGNLGHLRATAEALGVADRVHFGGFVSRAELRALYEHAAALAFASLLGPNNLPPQEAAVLGCPMILSDLPGHREQLGGGALYAPPLQPVAWAHAMQQILADAALRAKLVAAARQAIAPCTLENYVAGLGGLFAELALRRRLWA